MRQKYLITRLVLPLSIVALAAIVLGCFFPWQGLFINFFTTFIGILITVFYVNLILNEHEKLRWSGVTSRIYNRIEKMANLTISTVGTVFITGGEVYRHDILLSGDKKEIRKEVIQAANETIPLAIQLNIDGLNQDGWKKLLGVLSDAGKNWDRLAERYETYSEMSPDILSSMFKISDGIDDMIANYILGSTIYGVPDGDLKPLNNGESPIVLKRWFYKQAIDTIFSILAATGELLLKLGENRLN